MKFNVEQIDPVNDRYDYLVIGITNKKKLSPKAIEIDKLTKGYLSKILKQGDLAHYAGATLSLRDVPQLTPTKLLLVYCGAEEGLIEPSYYHVMSQVATFLKTSVAKKIAIYLDGFHVGNRDLAWKIKLAVRTFSEVFYEFNECKSKKSASTVSLNKIIFHVDEKSQLRMFKSIAHEASIIAKAMTLAKDLSNLPANICTPAYMARQATTLAKQYDRLKTTILDKKAMKKLGMHALLAVANASCEPPKLVVMQYNATPQKSIKPIILVGKGVTFDAGGLSTKQAEEMFDMKYDMCGAANIIAIMQAVAQLKLPIHLICIAPMVENVLGSRAYKPSDVIKTMLGLTVEIINTDAEGRLILADALCYSKRFNPEIVIDVATISPNVIETLGAVASGLISTDDKLAAALKHAADVSYDRIWQFPFWPDYQSMIDSPVADIVNTGSGVMGKSCIAGGCFLARFTQGMRWAHLDIAGTAWQLGHSKSATARSIPLLMEFLLNQNHA